MMKTYLSRLRLAARKGTHVQLNGPDEGRRRRRRHLPPVVDPERPARRDDGDEQVSLAELRQRASDVSQRPGSTRPPLHIVQSLSPTGAPS